MDGAVGVDGGGLSGDEFAAHVDAESLLRADEANLVRVHAADGRNVERDGRLFAGSFDRCGCEAVIGDVVRTADMRCVLREYVRVDLLGTGKDFEAVRSARVDAFPLK